VPERIGLGRSSRRLSRRKSIGESRYTATRSERCLRRKPLGPWPVKPRLAIASFLYPGPQGSGRHVSHVTGNEATATRDRATRRKFGWRKPCEAQASSSEHGDRLDPWLCSRVVWVAEVDEQRLVLATRRRKVAKRAGSSRQALPSQRGSSAVKQRWIRLAVAKATSTRAARPVGPREGALVDGRRPGSSKSSSFDEAAAEVDRAGPGDGDAAWPEARGQLFAVGRVGSTQARGIGRQKLRRMLGSRLKTPGPGGSATEEPSIAAPPGLRWVWCTWASRAPTLDVPS
jgi:hypothetical protein